MRQQWIMGNWKMHGSKHEIEQLCRALVAQLPATAPCVVFPSFVHLSMVQSMLQASGVRWGAQNVYPADSGAWTGEVSGAMLRDFGCQFVLVGHSERRHFLNEDKKFIAEKFHYVKDRGMIPVLCVGETLSAREAGLTEAFLTEQLEAIILPERQDVFQNCVIAYEPVWAIGTGRSASAEEAEAAHVFIRQTVAAVDAAQAAVLPILYGGSVTEKNALELLSMPNVDGGLVGGASLDARRFVEIVQCIKSF
jgi:triosephosphate isomerase